MNILSTPFGWLFTTLAVIFALGVAPRWARCFYPLSPPWPVRLAAPIIFAILAWACFLGLGLPALVAVLILGLLQIIGSRWGRRRKPSL